MSDTSAKFVEPGTPPLYNTIFHKFYDPDASEGGRLTGLIGYGLYKRAKREWAMSFLDTFGRPPTTEDLHNYALTWTDSLIETNVEGAETALAAYAATVIEAATPGIREDALKGTFAASVRASVLAAVIYTLSLLVLAIILEVSGVDVLGVMSKIHSLAHPP